MNNRNYLIPVVLLALCQPAASENSYQVSKILENVPVSTAQSHTQQTPIAYRNSSVYIASIEPGANGDLDGIDLLTVIRKGTPNEAGDWEWSSNVVDRQTVHDKWHTAPSIALDKEGYIHIAYNMHNFPWQYKVSIEPENITNFEFRGQKISRKELSDAKFRNSTSFKTLGEASIPGNQITYPAFFTDQNQDLYITYRYAAKPARKFADRTMSSAIARYWPDKQSWTNIGAPVAMTKIDFEQPWFAKSKIPWAFSSEAGWTSYHPRLTFGPDNTLHVNWFWREGIAGEKLERPCYLKSKDQITFTTAKGEPMNLPATPSLCGNLGTEKDATFFGIGNSTIDSEGTPHILLSPTDGDRQIAFYQNGDWILEESPQGATEIFFDAEEKLWAISSGPRIFMRENKNVDWQLIYQEEPKTNCFPRVSLSENKTRAFIYTLSCKQDTTTIYTINLL